VEALIHRIKHMNPRAKQTRVNFGDVPISQVFDLKGFNLNAKLEIDPEFLKADDHEHGTTATTTTITKATTTSTARTATIRTTTPTTTT
jgi:G3E family GTPase